MPGILLEAEHIRVNFGDRRVLDIDRVAIRDGDRIGLIGENGAGKSTLLSILSGECQPDAGTVSRRCPVALIRQTGDADGGIDRRTKSRFHTPEAREGLSGGELTRRRIAAALSAGAVLLMADEPTVDLDAQGIALLKEQLAAHDGALLLVSHDRDLLNALCGRIWQLEDGRITDFPGGYDAWQAERGRQRERQQFEYDQYRSETARLKAAAQKQAEWAASVRKAPSRMGNSEARLHKREYTGAVIGLSRAKKKLEGRVARMEKKERPRDLPDIRMALGSSRPIAAKVALSVQCKRLEVGGRTLLTDTSLSLPTGTRTALMGPNGCGKTTLLRAILGAPAPGARFEGTVRLNPGAKVGVFDQDHARSLDFDRTVLSNAMDLSSLAESTARTVLARLNLRGDQVFKPVSLLSGGERAKTALARLLLGDFNLLILDEPTNHLDVFTLEALEALLAGYGGTLLFVSHDRTFVERVATRLVMFDGTRLTTHEEGLARLEARRGTDRAREERQLEISAVEMRMAALSARISSPRKGDKPQL